MKRFIVSLLLFLMPLFVFAEEKYVTELKVDDLVYEDFKSDKTEYEIRVASNKNTIKLVYIFDSNIYFNQGGYGDLSLNYGDNNFSFTVTNKENSELTRTYHIKVIREDSRSKDNSLKSLYVNSNQVILTAENDYTISVDSKLNSVEIKATLNSDKASFVQGYGERIGSNSLPLNGELTTYELRVKAENESIRTYKLSIKKKDYKSSDNSLKSLTIDKIDFKFKKDVLEYNLNVKHEIDRIVVEAIANDSNATLDYSKNYTLKDGINNIEVKVIAEDSKEKVYKINITREEEIPIVNDIKISGIEFVFDPKTYSYKIETELDELDFNVTLNNEESTCEILNNENIKNNSVVKVVAKNNDKSVTYSFKIIKEEEEAVLDLDSDKEELNENNFFKDNEFLIALVVFGVGVFSLLISIIVKNKSKVV